MNPVVSGSPTKAEHEEAHRKRDELVLLVQSYKIVYLGLVPSFEPCNYPKNADKCEHVRKYLEEACGQSRLG